MRPAANDVQLLYNALAVCSCLPEEAGCSNRTSVPSLPYIYAGSPHTGRLRSVRRHNYIRTAVRFPIYRKVPCRRVTSFCHAAEGAVGGITP